MVNDLINQSNSATETSSEKDVSACENDKNIGKSNAEKTKSVKTTENEKQKKTISKKIAYSGILAATLIAGKYVLSFLPNVEIVSPIIMLSAAFLGLAITMPATLVFVLIDTLIYGFYPSVLIQYLFHFPLLTLFSYLLAKRKDSLLSLVILSFVISILFWVETPILNVIFKFSLFLPTLISGIPFMALQAVSSIAFLLVLYKPFKEKLTMNLFA